MPSLGKWVHMLGLSAKVVATGLVAAGVGTAVTIGITSGSGASEAVVTRVVDGDTIDVAIGGRDERVRLLNVDTPESVDPNRPVQCLGPEATAFLESLLPQGTPVRLEYDDVRTDRYDRTLAGVFTADGTLVNAQVARAGLAAVVVFDDNDRFLPPVEAARKEAEHEGIGLYSADIACTVPAQVAQLEETVAQNPAVTPAANAPSTEFVAAAAVPQAVAEAAAALSRLLAEESPVVAVLPGDERARIVTRVDGIRQEAQAQRSGLQAAGQERRRTEAAEVAQLAEEEERRAEAERQAQQQREQEQRAEREREERAEREREAAVPRPEREAPAPERSSNPYPGYTGPRCYDPGGVTWSPCPG